ncbi:RHS repeat domain-containing protein [Oligoflexus tunisiensis]|uniref:RHS repeat domain-containing protein n=1 Tax=Oligoflexus tunisiensis TaxID=708132 RepID=UPI000ACFE444|nr:RHS repeat-associated core domain-containing protein [Oligoflexus tunisiensis]
MRTILTSVIFLIASLSFGNNAVACGLSPQFALNGSSPASGGSGYMPVGSDQAMSCTAIHLTCGWKLNFSSPDGNGTGTSDCGVSNSIDGTEGTGYCSGIGQVQITRPGVTLADLQSAVEQTINELNARNWDHPPDAGTYSGSFGGYFDCRALSEFAVPSAAQQDPDTSKDECGGIGSTQKGSIIGCRDQSLAQKVEISGTPFHLSYNSLRINKFKRPTKKLYFKVPRFPTGFEQDNRWKVVGVSGILEIAGRQITVQATDPDATSWDLEFSWDRKDALGNDVTTYAEGEVTISYQYVSGWVAGSPNTIIQKHPVRLAPFGYPSDTKMGHWTISEVHSYDAETGTIYLGNGADITDATTFFQKNPDSQGYFIVPSHDGGSIYRFDSNRKHVATIDVLTGVILYSFQYTDGLLSRIVDRNNQITRILRYPDGNVSAIRSPYGITTALAYDSNGNLAEIKNPLGFTNTFTYYDGNRAHLMASMTDALGKTKSYIFTEHGKLAEAIDAKGYNKRIQASKSETSQSYSEYATFSSPMGFVTTYESTYGWDRTKKNINLLPSGYSVQESFNGDRSQLQVRDNHGYSSTTQYTSHPLFGNRQVEQSKYIEGQGGGIVNFERQYTVTDPANPYDIATMIENQTFDGIGTYSTAFDKATRTFTTTTPMGRQYKEILNAKGRPVKMKSPGIQAVALQYNTKGQPTSVTQGTRSYSMTYNSQGLLATITNPLNEVTNYSYDAAGQLTTLTLPNNQSYQFAYNGNGDRSGITTAASGTYSYGFDDNRNLVLNTEPMIRSRTFAWAWTYNLDDQPTQMTRPNNTTVDLTYDDKGNLQTLTGPGVSRSYTWSNGALQSISTSTNVQVSFDQGRLPNSTTWFGPVNGNLSYEWNTFDRLSKLRVNGSDESTISYMYDADGDLTQANNLAYTRNPNTGRLSRSALNGIVTTHIYDTYGAEAESVLKVKGKEFLRFQYSYDELGRIATRTRVANATSSVTQYAYDAIGQLISEVKDGMSQTYSYTSTGNRLTGGGQEVYDTHDRLVSDATWTYTYNLGGHLKRKDNKIDGSWVTYRYDALGNLLGVNFSNGTTVRYLVDGLNRRIRTRTNDQFTAAFIYQDGLRPVAQLNPNGSVKAIFVYGQKRNVPDLMIKSGVSYRIISDHLGSPIYVIRAGNGQIMQEIEYDTWGNVLSDSNPGFQPFGFAGGLYDSTTRLLRFGARDYDPSIGRWLNKDPIRFDGGLNLYRYVENDPVNNIDPTGLYTEVQIWSPGKDIASAFGHVTVNVNGKVYSFVPSKMYTYPADLFINARVGNGGNAVGLILGLTPAQESQLVDDLGSQSTYNIFTNNCSQSTERSLKKAGVNIGGSLLNMFPAGLGETLLNSPSLIGVKFYGIGGH